MSPAMLLARSALLASAGIGVCGVGGAAHASETKTYSYDALGRLRLMSIAGGTNDGMTLTLVDDAGDNRLQTNVWKLPAVIVIPQAGTTMIPIRP